MVKLFCTQLGIPQTFLSPKIGELKCRSTLQIIQQDCPSSQTPTHESGALLGKSLDIGGAGRLWAALERCLCQHTRKFCVRQCFLPELQGKKRCRTVAAHANVFKTTRAGPHVDLVLHIEDVLRFSAAVTCGAPIALSSALQLFCSYIWIWAGWPIFIRHRLVLGKSSSFQAYYSYVGVSWSTDLQQKCHQLKNLPSDSYRHL